jgi:hypothetical protein
LSANPGIQEKVFEHYTALVPSSNEILWQTPIALFEMKADQQRIASQNNGMPIGSTGTHRVKCYFREKGAAVWQEYGHYPITIKWASSLIATPN